MRLVFEGGLNDLHVVGYVYMWYGGDGRFGCSIICYYVYVVVIVNACVGLDFLDC